MAGHGCLVAWHLGNAPAACLRILCLPVANVNNQQHAVAYRIGTLRPPSARRRFALLGNGIARTSETRNAPFGGTDAPIVYTEMNGPSMHVLIDRSASDT